MRNPVLAVVAGALLAMALAWMALGMGELVATGCDAVGEEPGVFPVLLLVGMVACAVLLSRR